MIEIRPMSFEHIPQVWEIERRIFPLPWTKDMFTSEISDRPRSSYFIAEDNEKVIGYAGMFTVADEAHITNLAVTPEYQKRGIGTALVVELLERCLERRARHIVLEVRKSNIRARKLYERFGFKEVGIRKAYYEDNKEDAVVLCTGDILNPNYRYELNTIRSSVLEKNIKLFSKEKIILAIETTCDETSVAVVGNGFRILSNLIASQVNLHKKYGGVVPELAARRHLEAINPMVEEALTQAQVELNDLSAIAVSIGPGLVGALLVGLAAAKVFSWVLNVPMIGVNHLEGHIYANFMENPKISPPFVSLVVSGGHTLLVYVPEWGIFELLGETLDDAAGEAFDKIAGFLDLGYPGGPLIDELSRKGNPHAIEFPRALLHTHDYNFSLSGLKTAVLNYVTALKKKEQKVSVADIAASFQEAVIEVQVEKSIRAAQEKGSDKILLAGGVASNTALRDRFEKRASQLGVSVHSPSPVLCTDNAAMIGGAAFHHLLERHFLGLDADVDPNASLSKLVSK